MWPLILAGAGAALLLKKKQAAKAPTVPTSQPSKYQPAQPSQTYPFRPVVPPRVDNSNQPWYNGPRSFMSGPAETAMDTSKMLVAGSSVIQSVGDVWGQMSDWFGGNDDKALLTSTDSLPADNPDVAGAASDQSDNVGSAAADEYDSGMPQ